MGCGLPKMSVVVPNLREFLAHKYWCPYFLLLKVGNYAFAFPVYMGFAMHWRFWVLPVS
jgi:hypothetical protein